MNVINQSSWLMDLQARLHECVNGAIEQGLNGTYYYHIYILSMCTYWFLILKIHMLHK